MKKNLFVAMAGNIGAGKTTASRLITQELGFDLFAEPVLNNRFLKQYYEDMARWSFTLQLEFLMKRVEHHQIIEAAGRPCVQDRTLVEDPEIFAKYLHGLGYMTDSELDLYFDYFRYFNSHLRQPDKVIFVDVPDVDELMRRIRNRARVEERGMRADFLRGLHAFYSTFPQVLRKKYSIDTLVVDVTKCDVRQGVGRQKFLDVVIPFLLHDTAPEGQLALLTDK